MVGVAKGLTLRTVTPALVGSNPITHPIYVLKIIVVNLIVTNNHINYCWGVAKLVRHGTLTPARVGSSPAAPAIIII